MNAHQSGVRVPTLLTNSRLSTMGSGVALVGPSMKFDYSVDKTLRGSITLPLGQIYAENQNKVKTIADLILILESLCKDLVGQVYQPDDSLLTYGPIIVIKNNNQSPVLVNSAEVRQQIGTERIQVRLRVSLYDSQPAMKLRGPGIKATTLPYDVTLHYLDDYGVVTHTRQLGNEVLLNNEVRKGNYLLVSAFCENLKRTQPHIRPEFAEDGHLWLVDTKTEQNCPKFINVAPEGYPEEMEEVDDLFYEQERINLLDADNKIISWAAKQIVKMILEFQISRKFYEDNLFLFQHSDVECEILSDKAVLVKEQVNCLECDIVYSLEVSTPKENTGTSAIILEQMFTAMTMYPPLAKLWERGQQAREVILNFVEYASADEHPEAAQISLDDLVDIVPVDLTGRNLIKHMDSIAKQFCSSGTLCLTSTNEAGDYEELFINFPSLLALVSFEAGGHVPTGIAESIETLLRFSIVADPASSGYLNRRHGLLRGLNSLLLNWIDSVTDARGIMKTLARTTNLAQSGKVKNTLSPALCPDADGLPIVMMHPNCPLVKGGNVVDGDIVAIFRTPMPFLSMCQVKLSNDGIVGHVMVCPEVWARNNNGDGDGDPVAFINITDLL